MKNIKIKQFLQSFVAIPIFAVTMPVTGVPTITPMTPELANISSVIESTLITPEEESLRKEQAKIIDDFLEKRKSPLAGYGRKFVDEAAKNELDYRLLVAIAGRESTFALHACKKATNSFLGYGSCKMNFSSPDQAIEKVSASLGGQSKHYHSEMTTYQILRKYNTVIKNYPNEVIRIMNMIGPAPEELS